MKSFTNHPSNLVFLVIKRRTPNKILYHHGAFFMNAESFSRFISITKVDCLSNITGHSLDQPHCGIDSKKNVSRIGISAVYLQCCNFFDAVPCRIYLPCKYSLCTSSLLKERFCSFFSHLYVGILCMLWHIGSLEPHQQFAPLLALAHFGIASPSLRSVWNRFLLSLEPLFFHSVAGLSIIRQRWYKWFS
jgi:hypothetical protein